MNRLFIEATKATPRVELLPDGNLSILGRSLPEDPHGFYGPVLDWVTECKCETINLEIRLEYMNTSSYKQIYTLLSNISKNIYVNNIMIDWYYEEGDDDGYENGKEFESILSIPFRFHEYAEVL